MLRVVTCFRYQYLRPMVLKIFRSSLIFSILGLICSFFVGYYYTGLWSKAFEGLMITAILAVLEVSLSIDNAIVNAKILKDMDSLWRHRFLTWGMAVAVFGMRLIFPVLIVTVMAAITPWEALRMALWDPKLYAETMLKSHVAVSAFGGSFLLLVALAFFYDENKDHHWIGVLESRLVRWGHIEALEIFFTLGTVLLLSQWVSSSQDRLSYIQSGVAGILTFIAVKGLGQVLEGNAQKSSGVASVARTGLAGFIYLEVLDSSFSFDGVVGAFAITNNLIIIMIGLSIGAFFVRSLTILFVERETLKQFEFIEHGAFYAIALLAMLMLSSPWFHVPEWFTGLSGGAIILVSLLGSLQKRVQG